MNSPELSQYYSFAKQHQKQHKCTAVPYENREMLTGIVASRRSVNILEIGTGVGYSTACLASGSKSSQIDTIERNYEHIEIAKQQWETLRIQDKIFVYQGVAEDILPSLKSSYDIIFFDGGAPSLKFLPHFERLLKKGGMLITANLFLKDPKGGKYLRSLQNSEKWKTGINGDTAFSVKQ